ncbi:MAG: tetratricopeptide repeat protein [Pirellulales bacterium]|nr:tetratricopeptide repeat protein [Pirellulales bacterium]
MMEAKSNPEPDLVLKDKRVALVGRFAGMSQREAATLVRQRGATVSQTAGPHVDLIVVGEESLPLAGDESLDEVVDPATQDAIRQGSVEVIPEAQLWERLGMVDFSHEIHQLYTPAMLAELLGVPVAVVRRWRRRGLIVPAREVHRLPYFDFQEVATARRLAELLAAGTSPTAIERKLKTLAACLPGVTRPLAQLSVIVQGKDILLRQGDGLIEPGGQLRFDFEASETDAPYASSASCEEREGNTSVDDEMVESLSIMPPSPEQLAEMAAELEEAGSLAEAAEAYRAAMASAGPSPEWCFQVAELLYRLGDLPGARERYYMAIELDEDYVEARANLGCVLAELGETDLAIAAFQGALAHHSDYSDAHYHFARLLDAQGRPDEATAHWRAFLEKTPNSPWAEQARTRIERERKENPGAGD